MLIYYLGSEHFGGGLILHVGSAFVLIMLLSPGLMFIKNRHVLSLIICEAFLMIAILFLLFLVLSYFPISFYFLLGYYL
jgi:F0F1-type ATP synthase assembly protein I